MSILTKQRLWRRRNGQSERDAIIRIHLTVTPPPLTLLELVLRLRSLGTIDVVRVKCFMLFLLLFRELLPLLLFFRREAFPLLTDHLA